MPEPEKRTYEAQTVEPLSLRSSRQPEKKEDDNKTRIVEPDFSGMTFQQRRKLVQRLIDFIKTDA